MLMWRKILWTYESLCGICLYCKGGAEMAQYTIEEIYAGEKYHVLSDVMQEFFAKEDLLITTQRHGLICLS